MFCTYLTASGRILPKMADRLTARGANVTGRFKGRGPKVGNGFEGVEKCYAIQAGREIRIIVKPDEVDDLGSVRLARDVSKKIEESLEYPGQIKVTVIREKRSVEYAK